MFKLLTLKAFPSFCLVTLMLGLLPTPAAASLIDQYTYTIFTNSVPFTQTFDVAKFDPSLGTLVGISMTLETSGSATVKILNETLQNQGFTAATARLPLLITGPDGSFVEFVTTAGPASGTITAAPFAGGSMVLSIPGPVITGASNATVPEANFASYIGPGGSTMSFNAAATGFYSGSSDIADTLWFSGSGRVGGTFTIAYEYITTDVPEPVTMALFGSGLLIMGFLGRKRFIR